MCASRRLRLAAQSDQGRDCRHEEENIEDTDQTARICGLIAAVHCTDFPGPIQKSSLLNSHMRL